MGDDACDPAGVPDAGGVMGRNEAEQGSRPDATAGAAAAFPFHHQVERDVPAWAAFRPEGHSLAYTLHRPWRIARYLQKCRLMRYGTAPDELDYFNRQRVLFGALRRGAAPPAGAAAKLAVVGDIMWVRSNWSRFLDPAALDYLRTFDAVLGNLETPIDESAPPLEWYKLDAFKFNSDPRLIEAFHDPARGRNVFAAVSTANNHTFDRGDDGARRTLALLDRLGIGHSGVREHGAGDGIAVFERRGIRFGVYGACYGYNDPRYRSGLRYNRVPGLAPWPYRLDDMDLSDVDAALDAMDRAGVDFRILLLHWGHEFELYPTPVQVQLGRKLAAMGFDLIAGGHAHVLQPCEVCFVNGYRPPAGDAGCAIEGRGGRPRKSLVCYSLGNFSTAMLHWETKIGAILSLHVRRDPVTGLVDWEAPNLAFVYNVLSMHNRGRKELHLLSSYVQRHLDLLRTTFPRHRRIMGYLARHMLEPRAPEDLTRRAREEDFDWLLAWLDRQPTA